MVSHETLLRDLVDTLNDYLDEAKNDEDFLIETSITKTLDELKKKGIAPRLVATTLNELYFPTSRGRKNRIVDRKSIELERLENWNSGKPTKV